MYRMIVVNVTGFTLFLYKMISLFIDPTTRIKIKLFTSSHPKKLMKYMDNGQLIK